MIKKMAISILIYISPSFSMRIANKYWQNTDKTHLKMDEKVFLF